MQDIKFSLVTSAEAYQFIVTVALWPLCSSGTDDSITVCLSWTM